MRNDEKRLRNVEKRGNAVITAKKIATKFRACGAILAPAALRNDEAALRNDEKR